ncbi:MAG: polymer-forming cytoskeletal protein [Myxococcaceae bacterium]
MALLGGSPKQGEKSGKEDNVVQRAGELNALLGKGSEFEGKLTFEGQVRIDGKFTGQIQTKDTLVIGDGAKVQAEINAGTVIINGQVEGNIKAISLIEVHQPARVKGNLETPSLSMDRGVIFDGSVKMGDIGKGPPPAPEPKK